MWGQSHIVCHSSKITLITVTEANKLTLATIIEVNKITAATAIQANKTHLTNKTSTPISYTVHMHILRFLLKKLS